MLLVFFNNVLIKTSFIGIEAISLKHGLTASCFLEAELIKKILSCSEKVIGLTVHDNIEKSLYYNIGSASTLDEIITDNKVSKEVLKKYQKSNLKITIPK